VPRPPWREHYMEIWLLSNLNPSSSIFGTASRAELR
jgi:hypothetical protein